MTPAGEMLDAIEDGKDLGVVPALPWKWLRPLLGHMPDAVSKRLAWLIAISPLNRRP